jgi:hypothetical protein
MSSRPLAPLLKDAHPARTVAVAAKTKRSSAEDCTRIRELGYKLSGHAKLYGEKFEIVSDPFSEGGGVAVRVVTANNPAIRTLRLPVAILLGMSKFFPKRRVIEPQLQVSA